MTKMKMFVNGKILPGEDCGKLVPQLKAERIY